MVDGAQRLLIRVSRMVNCEFEVVDDKSASDLGQNREELWDIICMNWVGLKGTLVMECWMIRASR